MNKVTLSGHIIIPFEDRSIVLAELETHRRLTRNEPGCLCFKVTQNPDDTHRFDVYEEFVDHEAFLQHQRRVQESQWGKVTQNVARYYDITES